MTDQLFRPVTRCQRYQAAGIVSAMVLPTETKPYQALVGLCNPRNVADEELFLPTSTEALRILTSLTGFTP